MNKLIFITMISAGLFLTRHAHSQTSDDFVNDMVDRINVYFMSRAHDNVFVHTDRSVYFSGDYILFSASVTDAANLRPSDRSGTLTLMLINGQGAEVLSASFEVIHGFSDGSFRLPEDMDQGKYQLVCYVMNGDVITANKVFNKELIITDPENQLMADYQLERELYDAGDDFELKLQFFGYRSRPVSNVKIGYKIINGEQTIDSGKGKTGKDGTYIMNSSVPGAPEGNLVVEISAQKRREGQSFRILIPTEKVPDIASEKQENNAVQIELDRISDRRIAMKTRFSGSGIDENKQVVVALFRKGLLYWSAPGKLSQTRELTLPVGNIPSGILQVALFDIEGQLLGEKMIFLEREDKPSVSVHTEAESYRKRQPVRVDVMLDTNYFKNIPSGSRLSVSVVPEELSAGPAIPVDDYLLIGADLQQEVKYKLAEIRGSSGSSERLNRMINACDRNGYTWDFILGSKEAAISGESEDLAGEFMHSDFFPSYFNAPKMKDFSLGIKDKRHPDAEELNYKKQLESGISVLDVVRTIKPFTMDGNKIIFAGTTNSINFQQGALIVIDNQQMGEDASILRTIPPAQVESIFVSTDPGDIHQYTGLNVVGIIEITMIGYGSESRLSDETPRDKVVTDSYGKYLPGYPDYSIESDATSVLTDHRRLLYWNPDLLLEDNGRSSFEFYTSDMPGTYKVTVQGMIGTYPVAFSKKIAVK
ncbi:MAG: hypothetical protein K9J30_05680 [Bacteroidales bacterium]|nr:hypothetical protein [Bacteroidales bacterium]